MAFSRPGAARHCVVVVLAADVALGVPLPADGSAPGRVALEVSVLAG
ncbi:MAG TPA: hypothetical protein VEC19_08575 [Usitatibacter sp.]|nr:hypothetical protein [Usitatibacter sp.]